MLVKLLVLVERGSCTRAVTCQISTTVKPASYQRATRIQALFGLSKRAWETADI